jgi:hypothetical protein
MLGILDEEFAALHASSETERHELTVERDRIQDQRRTSLQAHYAGAPPLDLLKEEQDRLARQLDLVTARLDALGTIYEEARTHLQECLALAGDCQTVYTCGSDRHDPQDGQPGAHLGRPAAAGGQASHSNPHRSCRGFE